MLLQWLSACFLCVYVCYVLVVEYCSRVCGVLTLC